VGGGRGGDDGLDAWAAGARAQEAAAARARRHWLRQQADEQADFVSVLTDLRDRAAPATVVTRSGRSYRGTITVVGRDCLALVDDRGRTTFVASSAVWLVRPENEREVRLAIDTRETGSETMAALVRRAALDRPAVTVHSTGAQRPVVGELHSCGADVIGLLVTGEPAGAAYLRLASVSEMSFASG
jgi:hypothetical protein